MTDTTRKKLIKLHLKAVENLVLIDGQDGVFNDLVLENYTETVASIITIAMGITPKDEDATLQEVFGKKEGAQC